MLSVDSFRDDHDVVKVVVWDSERRNCLYILEVAAARHDVTLLGKKVALRSRLRDVIFHHDVTEHVPVMPDEVRIAIRNSFTGR